MFHMYPRAIFMMLAAITLGGCSANAPPAPHFADTENLSKIERAYHADLQKLGRPPANADQLKPYLKEFGDPDAILRSPRDGEPYVIIYGVDIRKPFSMPPPIWLYEKHGADGKRYVMTIMGMMCMTDEEFANAKFVTP
jgi:hypothetical protein